MKDKTEIIVVASVVIALVGVQVALAIHEYFVFKDLIKNCLP